MSVKRVYRKAERTPAQIAELEAIRAHYQATKPTLDEAVAESGVAAVPLGEVLAMHAVLAQLKQERVRRGMSLADVERISHIDQACLSRLENGKVVNPTVSTISRFAAALGKSVGYTLTDSPPEVQRVACAGS